jgi:hypothetical protein
METIPWMESITALPAEKHRVITELAIAEAQKRSLGSDDRAWWVQTAWMPPRNGIRRCWRWACYVFGTRVAQIVWFRGRGYCVTVRSRWIGDFDDLDVALTRGHLAATVVPRAVFDIFATLGPDRRDRVAQGSRPVRCRRRERASAIVLSPGP